LKLLSPGYSLRAPELLFRKIEDAEVEAQVQKLILKSNSLEQQQAGDEGTQPTSAPNQNEISIAPNNETISAENESKPEITYDDFAKLDLRIGTITAAEKVKKADKLLKLEVDLGFEKRTIVSGIAQHFSPESLIHKQVIIVANLAARKMRGIESQGMILTAEQPDGKLILVNPDSLTENGSNVR
ncbi:MAG: methionine--tRNA ligase subunit beta, partial [Chitinophagaceae bacterium]